MKTVCKAFVIVEIEECAKLLLLRQMKSVWKAFIVENEECVESFCYCGEDCVQSFCYCGE